MSCQREETSSCCKDNCSSQANGFLIAIVLYILLAIILMGTRVC